VVKEEALPRAQPVVEDEAPPPANHDIGEPHA